VEVLESVGQCEVLHVLPVLDTFVEVVGLSELQVVVNKFPIDFILGVGERNESSDNSSTTRGLHGSTKFTVPQES
jgi:hypothetical protein